jgi:hypothetical protein
VATVGFGDDAGAAPRAPSPTGEIETLCDLVGARRRLRRPRVDFRRLDYVAGSAIQSVCQLFSSGPFAHLWFDKLYGGILSSLILYTVILAVSNVLDSRVSLAYQQTESARLNEQLSKSKLNALRQQSDRIFCSIRSTPYQDWYVREGTMLR